MGTFFVMLFVFFFSAMIFNWINKSDEKDIRKWANSKGFDVKDIKTHVNVVNTPFYFLSQGSFIYEVNMRSGEKWWVRTSLFGNDYEKG